MSAPTTALAPTRADPDLTARPSTRDRSLRNVSVAADLAAVAAVGWALWHLVGHDGGTDLVQLRAAAWPLLLAAPIAAWELRHWPRRVGWALTAFGGAALLSIALALYRSDFVAPAIVYAVMPIAALLTLRIWRRDWGPLAVAAIVTVAFARSWNDSFLAWTGSLLSAEFQDRWLALSWHNQSAALMGGFGLFFAGIAVATRRAGMAAVAIVLAAGAFSGVWLSGSRGGVATTLLGLAMLAVLARFRRPGRWLALAVATVAATVALLSMPAAGTGVELAIADKPVAATESVAARLDHMAAAVHMFFDRPLTGQGIGAYGMAAPPFSDPGTNLTYHAHNEFLEWFGEGGILLGAAGLVLVGGVGLALLRLARRGLPDPGDTIDRRSVIAGAVAATAGLAVHAAVDFDWLFPVLAVLLAVVAAIVFGAAPPTSTRRGAWWMLLPVIGLLIFGIAASGIETGSSGDQVEPEDLVSAVPPWNAAGAWEIAEILTSAGRPDLAADAVARSAVWNPGEPVLQTYEAALELRRGTGGAAEVVATLDPGRSSFFAYNVAARHLMAAGELEAADAVLADVLDQYADYPGWNMGGHIRRTWELQVELATIRGGCPAAREAVALAAAHPTAERRGPPDLTRVLEWACD